MSTAGRQVVLRDLSEFSLSHKTVLWNKVHDGIFFVSEAVRFVLHLPFTVFPVHSSYYVGCLIPESFPLEQTQSTTFIFTKQTLQL
jgi:hypothetical protein